MDSKGTAHPIQRPAGLLGRRRHRAAPVATKVDVEEATTAGGAQAGAELRPSAARGWSRAGGRPRDSRPGLPPAAWSGHGAHPELPRGPALSLHPRGSSALCGAPLSLSLHLCPKLEGMGSVVPVAEGRCRRHRSAADPQTPGACATLRVTRQSPGCSREWDGPGGSPHPAPVPAQWLDSSDSKNGEEEKQEDSHDSGTREPGARASRSPGQSGGEAEGGAPSGAALSSSCRYLI